MSLAANQPVYAHAARPISAGISDPSQLKFPELLGPGAPVRARDFEVAGTALRRAVAYGFALFGLLVLTLSTMGIGLVALLLAPVIDYFLRRRMLAQIKGTSLEVGPNQLPEVYACVKAYAERLGLKEVPHIYVVEGNVVNAAAQRIGSRHVVHLVDDVVWGALKAGDPNALAFIIAHELAHHALGHTRALRAYLALTYRALGRLDELSCDAVALQLVGDREAAYNGLIMLMVGPQLLPYVNRKQLMAQAEQVAQDRATKKAERAHTHPFVARRLWELRNVRLEGSHPS
jgi:Zn-dependent protease with chaperone function